MRILSLYYTHKPGGFCKRLYLLLNSLAYRDHEVNYLCLDTPPNTLNSKVKFTRIPFPKFLGRTGFLFWLVFTVWSPIFTLFKSFQIKPERIVVFGAYYSAIASPAKFFTGATTILFIRSLVFEINKLTHESYFYRLFSAWLDKVGLVSADKVVCMTETMKTALEKFIGKPIKNVTILPNNIPKHSINVIGRENRVHFTILTSGVLDQRKNIEPLIDAFAMLKRNRPELTTKLIVAGDGPLRAQLEEHAISSGVPNIHFPGWLSNMNHLYEAASLVVHPSLHEGMSNSILEAIGAGLPVLASNTPENLELLGDSSAVIDPCNITSLSEKLETLLTSEQEMEKLRLISLKVAMKLNFDWEETASKIVEI